MESVCFSSLVSISGRGERQVECEATGLFDGTLIRKLVSPVKNLPLTPLVNEPDLWDLNYGFIFLWVFLLPKSAWERFEAASASLYSSDSSKSLVISYEKLEPFLRIV